MPKRYAVQPAELGYGYSVVDKALGTTVAVREDKGQAEQYRAFCERKYGARTR